MYFVVGLGNPGEEYKNTRHNIGRDIVIELGRRFSFEEFGFDKKRSSSVSEGEVGKDKVTLVLPETFMNKSGNAVGKFIKSKKQVKNLIVVHDDLDLPLGRMKIVFARGSGGHKGVESVKRALGTNEFTRIRIGVSRITPTGKTKKPATEEAVQKFVLGKWTSAEEKEIKNNIDRGIKALETIISDGLTQAMNSFN